MDSRQRLRSIFHKVKLNVLGASLALLLPSITLSVLAVTPRPPGTWVDPSLRLSKEVLPGITVLVGHDLKTDATTLPIPELADPYVTLLKDSVVISGTAQYMLRFASMADLAKGAAYQVVWNDFYYADGTAMEGNRFFAHSWDMKPVNWSKSAQGAPRLWDPLLDKESPLTVWYGGHMRPRAGNKTSVWPEDNYSRDVFAFLETETGKWVSQADSIFSKRKSWPRPIGNFLGHRYGHQIVMLGSTPVVFYEEVTQVKIDGTPALTQIMMDEMESPLAARGNPIELISPINPATGRPYPSAVREDGSALVEGPLYFRFNFEGELWEAVGFSAGSFYGRYPSSFASRKVSDGLQGKPYQLDLVDDGSDLHDAGAQLGSILNLVGGPGRPAVIVGSDGGAILDSQGRLQVLMHGYRRDLHPEPFHLDGSFRAMIYAPLKVSRGPKGVLRFDVVMPQGDLKPAWAKRFGARKFGTIIAWTTPSDASFMRTF